MNNFTINHMRHYDLSYSMTIKRGMGENRPMTDLVARKHSTDITFYELTPDEMLSLGAAICAEACKAREDK